MHIHPVILSGGSGTRLWPMSRAALPKQLLPLVSENSMLQETVLRLRGLAGIEPPLLVCNQEHRFIAAEQLRAINTPPAALLLEPVGRNTAPAVAVAAFTLLKRAPDALMLVLAADHMIKDVPAFHRAVEQAAALADAGHLVTFGIKPTAPETGFGYIERGDPLAAMAGSHKVARFVEKPNMKCAEEYVASGRFYWNSGMFMFKASSFLEELKRLQPAIYESAALALANSQSDLDFTRLEEKAFAACASISIDYAVMEHITHAAVVPLDSGWSDVGSWSSLWDVAEKDVNGNVVRGDVISQTTTNCLLRADSRMVATVGLDNVVVVETADVVFVANRDQAQDVKSIVNQLEKLGRSEHLTHQRVFRPWGWYQGIDAGERFQVKRIAVTPGHKLSLQRHQRRAEHWIVVSGTARVTRGEEVFELKENQSTYIPLGAVHRLENPGSETLYLIEVQSGDYLGEDDIERLQDDYKRN